mgnify:CR=1 FL=1
MSHYTALFKTDADPNNLYRCLKPEIHSSERASIEISIKEGIVEIKIEAKDSTALRAMTNSVTQMLSIFETTGRL